MEQYDKDTINTSLVQLTKGESSLDLGEQFLSLLKQYRIFSEEMINDILVRRGNESHSHQSRFSKRTALHFSHVLDSDLTNFDLVTCMQMNFRC